MEIRTQERSVGEIVRKAERDFIGGTTTISKYVEHSLYETIEREYAYLNSKHISGDTDSLGREKPFFNITVAAANIWYRATDIDRRHINFTSNYSSEWLNTLIFNARIQQWMRDAGFAVYLNNWGRTLARHGSAITKIVENDEGLFLSVIPWNGVICDAVNFGSNPVIEPIDLTEGELWQRVETHGYDKDMVQSLSEAQQQRETIGKTKKDTKSDYIRIYELHGLLPKSLLTHKEEHDNIFVQQMHVLSFVKRKENGKTFYDEYTLVSGQEEHSPYYIDHLIEEDGRTKAIGAVEYLFDAQWMENHAMKNAKDQLDVASRMVFQTADEAFMGRNVLNAMETGDIFIHKENMPLTQMNNSSHDITQLQNYAAVWKNVGNELVGISEAMLGAQPKSGTAWRQTEALLTESYSLFELMTENKGLAIEQKMRERIIPYIKKKLLDNTDEIVATLEDHDLHRIDGMFLKAKKKQIARDEMFERILNLQPVTQDMVGEAEADIEGRLKEGLQQMGNKRFFKPSEITKKTWKEQFKDVEKRLEMNFTGESKDTQQHLTTLNTALKLMLTPGFDQNDRAQKTVGKILELTGAMSPIEYATPSPYTIKAPSGVGGSNVPDVGGGESELKERNIKK